MYYRVVIVLPFKFSYIKVHEKHELSLTCHKKY